MTEHQILLVADKYAKHLAGMDIPARCYQDLNSHDSTTRLSHVRWMCEQLPEMRDAREKMDRWLGFIQGVLYAENIFTINDLRKHNVVSE